jgi:hypothetical protein
VQSFRAQNTIRIRILNYVKRPRWPVHDIFSILSGPVFMRKTRRGRDLEIVARRSGPPTGEFSPPTGEFPGGPTSTGQDIHLVHLAAGLYIYIFPMMGVMAGASPSGSAPLVPFRAPPPVPFGATFRFR